MTRLCCTVPGAAEPEPEGYRSSIVLQCNSRRSHLSAVPAPLTCFDHQLECHSSPTAMLRADDGRCTCAICTHEREYVPFLNTSIVSLFHFNFFFFFFFSDVHTGRMWEEKKTQRNSEIDTQTEGDLIWSRFSFGEIENLILPPNQYSDPLTNYHMTLTNMNCFPFIWFLRKILA